jgi:hypothetical protein
MRWLKFTKFFTCNRQAKVPKVFDNNETDGTIDNPVINENNVSLNDDNSQNIRMKTSNTSQEKRHPDVGHKNDYELPTKTMIMKDKEELSCRTHRDSNISVTTSNPASNLELSIENNGFIDLDNDYFTTIIQYIIRSNLVIIVIMMAISVPQFGDMINLVGGKLKSNFMTFFFISYVYFFSFDIFSYFISLLYYSVIPDILILVFISNLIVFI